MTAAVEAILRAGIDEGAFPGATALAARGNEILFQVAVGRRGIAAPFDHPLVTDTIYDLASVSKIYTLATALRVLRARGISWDTPLAHFLPAFSPLITLRHLVQHASGLEVHVQTLWDKPVAEWLPELAKAPVVKEPGTHVLYLCTNLFLLGRALVEIEKTPLETLATEYLLRPAGLKASFAPANLARVAPTEDKGNGSFYHGIVHDEAARSFREQTGDSAGNAGVFSDVADVWKFARLFASDDFFHPDDLAAIGATPIPEFGYWRGMGFQIDNPSYMSDLSPRGTWGHLGFTGPSLLVHRPTETVVVILNNRVHPTRVTPNRLPFHRDVAEVVFRSLSA
jgi:serine-type D-Ala-D-Ala carboxypeptidase